MKNCVILGYGVVGKALQTLAEQNPHLQLTNIFVRPEKADEPFFTSRGEEIVTDPSTDIVFECLSGQEPAHSLITQALKAGKHVISSNKAVLAAHLNEYLDLAQKHGGSIQMEASVAGGIPFLDALLKTSMLENLQGYEGIFNGTCNYILDSMQKKNLPFADALAQAQQLGYAEANPAADIEGIDVWNKAVISNSLAYKVPATPLARPEGISRISFDDLHLAKKYGRIIRHLAISRADETGWACVIAPVFLASDHFLSQIPENYNGQLIFTPSTGSLGYYGPGAGGSPTAQAMMADALSLVSHEIRPIILDNPLPFNPQVLKEDWLVRSGEDLSSLEGADSGYFKEKDCWLFKNQDADFMQKVKSLDPDALVAVWR